MTAALVITTWGQPQTWPRVMWTLACFDLAIAALSFPSNIVNVFGLK